MFGSERHEASVITSLRGLVFWPSGDPWRSSFYLSLDGRFVVSSGRTVFEESADHAWLEDRRAIVGTLG